MHRHFHGVPGVPVGLVVGRPLPGGGVPVAHLLHAGLFLPVGGDDAVAAEIVIRLPVPEIAAVAQHLPAVHVGIEQGLVHVVPDEAPVVLGEFLPQADIALHAPQGVAHVVHILAVQVGFSPVGFQILPDFRRGGVHPALHVGNGVEFPAVEHALVVHHPAGVRPPEEVRHGQDVRPGVGLVAAGPEEDGHMVLVPLKHGSGPVQNTVLPLRQASRHVPGGVHRHVLLPGAVGLHVGLVHHIDARPVAQVVPPALVGIVGGPHGVDPVGLEHGHGGVHVLVGDGPAPIRIPFMAVHAVEHQPPAVQGQHFVPDFHPAETGVIGDVLGEAALLVINPQLHPVQLRAAVIPPADHGEGKGLGVDIISIPDQLQAALKEGPVLGMGDFRPDGGHSLDDQPEVHGAAAGVRVEGSADPQVLDVGAGLAVEEHGAEDAAEAEEVLVLQPGGGAALVNLDAQPVSGGPDVGGQVKVRGGEGILAVAHKVAVEPDKGRLLNALEGHAHLLIQQSRGQIEPADVAAHGAVLPVHLRGQQTGMAVPGVELVGVVNLPEALGLHVPRNLNGAELSQIIILLPEIPGTGVRIGTPAEQPLAVQTLAQGTDPLRRLLG